MLTSVHIKNFRSCKDVKLEGLGPMLGLVGRNAAGKSTILQAIVRGARVSLTGDDFRPLKAGARVVPSELTLEVAVKGQHFRYTRDRTRETIDVRGSEAAWRRVLERDGGILAITSQDRRFSISESIAAMPALTALLPPDDSTNQQLAPLRDALDRIRYYPGPDADDTDGELSTPIPVEDYERWIQGVDADGRRGSSVLMRLLHAHETERARFDELQQLTGPRGLDLLGEIAVIEFGDTRGDLHYYDVRFAPTGFAGKHPLSLWELSGGTRRVLYLLVGLLFDQSSVMLVEQPEDGIHPALLTKLVDLLRVNADPTQIVLTSHSPVVLSSLQPKDVRLVSMHDGRTEVRALTDPEVERAQRYMQADGTLAEYLELIQEG